ncbi:hypothetical protein BH23ACT2_BH23ACT2_26740 [soil metagenome]
MVASIRTARSPASARFAGSGYAPTSTSTWVRAEAYETINRRFAEQAYNVYLWYSAWAVADAPNTHGTLGPDLPGEGARLPLES